MRLILEELILKELSKFDIKLYSIFLNKTKIRNRSLIMENKA
jgi:hypothetical protein